EILESLIEYAAKRGVTYMTFWTWSTENWQRDKGEVEAMMRLFRHVIKRRSQRLHEKGVRIRVIGDLTKFPADIKKALEDVVEQTKDNTTITAVFALNYGGRDEIIRSVNKILVSHSERSEESSEALALDASALPQHDRKITEQEFTQFLDTSGIPDPELIIRTGGEQRLSGFLLWQSEYSELYFPTWYMPDFTPERLDEAIEEFQKRKRRFGK
ncbi:di-trans,poly-cis-decaprenylcistransferase, partial [Candidatus Gottesmanbacteria bacterium]|nr:di-trans,poly-cis-decaprenylcistransferase [Candidatus Gottesmanbacteria bacterium]